MSFHHENPILTNELAAPGLAPPSIHTGQEVESGLKALSSTASGLPNPSAPASVPWWKPSFADVFVVALVVWTFASGPHGWASLLADGDAGWHIRVGEMILDSGSVPHVDPFSFSKPGQTWFAWEWLSDVGMALLHRAAGLKALVWFSAVLIAGFAGVLLRYMMWKGANALIALAFTLIAVGACSIHFLARPHLTTLLLIPITAWMVEADRLRPTWRLWILVPVFAVWTNLHGGFIAGLVILGAVAAGTAVESLWNGGSLLAESPRRYGILTACCAAVTVLNPYGIELHKHVFKYLGSDWIRDAVQEFQSPTFRGESAMQFEGLLFLGLIAAAYLIARKRVVETLWIAGLAHMALGSQRHITIYAAVVAPIVAVLLTGWWREFTAGKSKKSIPGILSQMSTDLAPAFSRNSIWGPLIFASLLLMGPPLVRWPQDFTDVMFPVELLQKHRVRIANSRVLTTDQWGDYLLYHNYPRQRVFVDGRSDFYGPELGKEYVRLLNGQHDWQQILNKHGFDLVVAPVEWPLTSLLKRDAGWKVVEDNGKAIVFEKVPVGVGRQSGDKGSTVSGRIADKG
jgi:hypothetical protein